MKRRFLKISMLGFILLIFLTACGKNNKESVMKDLEKKINNATNYSLSGEMEIINNEDSYKYQVDVAYSKEDKYKVSLKNLSNNHEQIILKNTDGVYVLTPSLNKSFKFQSSWPYNNSQVYLLQSIIKDLKLDKDYTYEFKDNYHIYTNKVNYPNNQQLVNQMVFIDNNMNIKEVQVMDENNKAMIKMNFSKIDLNASYDDKYFALDENLKANTTALDDIESPVMKLNETIYPMYIPADTHLASQETVETNAGERIILSFEGASPFTIIEETVKAEEVMEVYPTYGEMEMLSDTIGNVSDKSVSWISNNIEYYVTSSVLSKEELIKIAKNISVLPVMK